MKTFLTATLALVMMSIPASAATIKQAWNLAADATISNGTVNGHVTAPSECLLDNEYLFSCRNNHPAEEELPPA